MTEVTNRTEVLRIYTHFTIIVIQIKNWRSNSLNPGQTWLGICGRNIAGHLLFAPSKFVGYVNNNFRDYEQNKVSADGRDTNNALEILYGKEREINICFPNLISR